ncbi:MAG: hypothetical protein JWR27_2396, partial [Aeromicrobium sp.]|nr:hypothetical protein [Aeromicrobium sp.]
KAPSPATVAQTASPAPAPPAEPKSKPAATLDEPISPEPEDTVIYSSETPSS